MAEKKKTIPAPSLKITPPGEIEEGRNPLATTQELSVDDLNQVEPPELRATMEISTEELEVVKPPAVPENKES